MKKFLNISISFLMLLSFITISKAEAAKLPFDYELVYQSPYPSTLAPGATTNVWIEVKNSGTVAWNKEGIINAVRLGAGSKYGNTNQQRDYTSEFANNDWLSENRPAKVLHSEVRSGWHTRFQFNIKAPTAPGNYKAYFTPVVEGVEWMKDIGIYWEISVSGDTSFCVPEGGSLGALVPDNNTQCCAGLEPYVPEGVTGDRGTCQIAGYTPPAGEEVAVNSLTLSPNSNFSIKSGETKDFILIANYSDGSNQNVTGMAAWDVIYDTGTGAIHRYVPGRFIAGGMGNCWVKAEFNGKIIQSGLITITGLGGN